MNDHTRDAMSIALGAYNNTGFFGMGGAAGSAGAVNTATAAQMQAQMQAAQDMRARIMADMQSQMLREAPVKRPPALLELTLRWANNGIIVKVGPDLWTATEDNLQTVLSAAITANQLEK